MSDGQTGGCHDSITGNFKKITLYHVFINFKTITIDHVFINFKTITIDHVLINFKTITIDHSGAIHELHNAKRMGFALMVRA